MSYSSLELRVVADAGLRHGSHEPAGRDGRGAGSTLGLGMVINQSGHILPMPVVLLCAATSAEIGLP
jgi:hypothetical protein